VDIVRDEPSAVIDEMLIATNEEQNVREEVEIAQELESPRSPLKQRRSASSSGSPEKLPEDDEIVFWASDPQQFYDALPEQWYYKWRWTDITESGRTTPCLWEWE
jgi:hypothetical protein